MNRFPVILTIFLLTLAPVRGQAQDAADFAAENEQQETWLRCGAVLDVERGRLGGPTTIVVRGDRIERLVDGHPEAGSGDGTAPTIEDLSALTCLPGLMDMHTHLTSESSPTRYVERFTESEADVALKSTVYAKRTLAAGFTTVRDLGDSYNASIALRDAINDGIVDGPRIFTSGKSLATTGGHADPTNGWRADLMVEAGMEPAEAIRTATVRAAELLGVTDDAGTLASGKWADVIAVSENPLADVDELTDVDFVMKAGRVYKRP
ncbi:MAG: amidohydrolase family protein [Wenzhouxiangellaceae bacterium]|nr:amidohydrolase family protein [Wenzhouxiangellaceae bacterium]